MQNQVIIIRSVLKVKFTKYCTGAWGAPVEDGKDSKGRTGFSIIVELEPYMLEAYLGNEQKLHDRSIFHHAHVESSHH